MYIKCTKQWVPFWHIILARTWQALWYRPLVLICPLPSHLSLSQSTTSISVENCLQSFYLLPSMSCLVRRPQGTPILTMMDITIFWLTIRALLIVGNNTYLCFKILRDQIGTVLEASPLLDSWSNSGGAMQKKIINQWCYPAVNPKIYNTNLLCEMSWLLQQ